MAVSDCVYCDGEGLPGGVQCPECGLTVEPPTVPAPIVAGGIGADDVTHDEIKPPTLSFEELEPTTAPPAPEKLETLSFEELDPTGAGAPGLEPMPVAEPAAPPAAPLPVFKPVAEEPPPTEVLPVFTPGQPPRQRGRGARRARPGRRAPRAPAAPPVPGPEPAPIQQHAEIELRARYEYSSVPADDPPLMGVLVEMEAVGQPLVSGGAGPVAHVVLALDLSASMDRDDKFPVMRDAVGAMLDDLKAPDAADVLLSVVVFSEGAEVLMRDVPARAVDRADLFGRLRAHPLCFGRYTDVAGALSRAGRIAYDQCKRSRTLPVRIYLLTDGNPQDMPRARDVAARLSKIPADIQALAFGADADVSVLQELFSGHRGGTVKSVRADTIESAFERVAEVAQRVVATRCLVSVNLAAGAVGGNVFRYRPARVRFPEPAFEDGKRFRADLGTLETGRRYSLLLEIRPPETDASATTLGEVVVSIPGFGGPVTRTLTMTMPRTPPETEPGDLDAGVRTARDILGTLTDDDPAVTLRALRLRRQLYAEEKRDPGLLRILDKAIGILEANGSLEDLSPGDMATLQAHTCTGSGEQKTGLVMLD